MPRTADLREPQLPGLSSSDAAVCLPPLGGNTRRHRRPPTRLGETEQAARLQNAAGRRSSNFPLDGAALALRFFASRYFACVQRIGKASLGRTRLERLLLAFMRRPTGKPD